MWFVRTDKRRSTSLTRYYTMNSQDAFWFLRPTLGVVVCYLIAISAALLIGQKSADETDKELAEVERLASQMQTLIRPSIEFTPEDVVRIQIQSLASKEGSDGILQCMRLASPDNLATTGPLERFGRMVRGPRFGALAEPDAVVVGTPDYVDKSARVLVTLVYERQLRSFVWVLAKQTQPPYDGCWMTDAVFPIAHEDDLSMPVMGVDEA